MKPVMIMAAATLLIACNGDGTAAESAKSVDDDSAPAAASPPARNSKIIVRVVDTESISQAGGMFKSCEISFEADNRFRQAARSLTISYRPEAPDSADQAVINASGDMTFYFRGLKKGKSSHTSTVRGVDCEAISGLTVKEYFCSLQNEACPSGALTLDGGSTFDIQMPPA